MHIRIGSSSEDATHSLVKSLAFAMAMHSAEVGSILHDVHVYATHAGVARAALDTIDRACEGALKEGCRVMPLAEVCISAV